MGGSSHQNDPAVATQASAGANAAGMASARLSDENLREQKQQYATLFGEDGRSGSLTPILDPNSLKVSGPTGTYGLQYNLARGLLSKNLAAARGALKRDQQNAGFGPDSPSGMTADQARKLELGAADASGTLFGDFADKSYQDALANFWNAINIASGQAASARSGALQGSANAGSTYSNLYGTAAQRYTEPGLGGAILGTVGTLGSAAMKFATPCPVEGSLIAMVDGSMKPVEQVKKGDLLIGLDLEPVPVKQVVSLQHNCVEVTTKNGLTARVSAEHMFAKFGGGYVHASEALDIPIVTKLGGSSVLSIVPIGSKTIYALSLGGSHSYLCDGLWSLA